MREVLSGRGLVENQRGSRCEWVLGFARTAVMRAGSNMGPGLGGQGEGAQWAWTCKKPTGVPIQTPVAGESSSVCE